MRVFYYLIFLSNLFTFAHCFISIEELNCEKNVSLVWLWNLRNNNRCVYIASSLSIPECFFKQVHNTKFVVRIITLERLLSRNIYNSSRSNCDNFFVFTKNTTYINALFQHKENEKRFFPFSQIFLVTPDIEFDHGTMEYIYKNGLNVYFMEHAFTKMENGLIVFESTTNVLTKKYFKFTSIRSDAAAYFGLYKDHPLLSNRSSNKTFRVSLFNCPPYVVYLPGNNNFDGLEYRILKEITDPWKIQHKKCDISSTITDPWSTVLYSVNNESSDLAMCSVWLNVKSHTYYDTTNEVDYQCGTFLVPKPRLINPAAYIYMSLSTNVWMAFILSFVLVSTISTLMARIGEKMFKNSWNDKIYIDLTRSFLDSMKVATVHGIEKFPRQESMKTLYCSWILVSLIIGVAYCTGYTSLLTHPISTKPVDDLIQFLENGLYWSVVAGANSLAPTLNASGVTTLVQLSKRTFEKGSSTNDDFFNEKNALFVKIITNSYVTDISDKTDPTYSLRVMKSCFLNYYSVVALKKYSSYTNYFNDKIRAYREFGLTLYWALNMKGAHNNYMKPYFRIDDKTTSDGPTQLTLTTLTGAFVLLCVGLCVSSVTFLIECLFAACCANKHRFKVISVVYIL